MYIKTLSYGNTTKNTNTTRSKIFPNIIYWTELNQLKDLRTKLNQVTVKFGQVKISQIKLKETEESLKKQLADLEKQEVDIAKSLSNKYGKGSINIETGTFTPSE